MIPIPSLFQKDSVTGLAMPKLNPGCEWILTPDNGIMTVKIDGIATLVEFIKDDGWVLSKPNASNPELWERVTKFSDPFLWQAFDNLEIKHPGVYVSYGKGIKGDPHRINDTFMIKIFPADYCLLIKREDTKIRKGPLSNVETLFDAIKYELEESPEIEGLVFHLEGVDMKIEKVCQVSKQDFGIPWPTIVDISTVN